MEKQKRKNEKLKWKKKQKMKWQKKKSKWKGEKQEKKRKTKKEETPLANGHRVTRGYYLILVIFLVLHVLGIPFQITFELEWGWGLILGSTQI